MIQGHVGVTSWRFESSLRHSAHQPLSDLLPSLQRAGKRAFLLGNCTKSAPQILLKTHTKLTRYGEFCLTLWVACVRIIGLKLRVAHAGAGKGRDLPAICSACPPNWVGSFGGSLRLMCSSRPWSAT